MSFDTNEIRLKLQKDNAVRDRIARRAFELFVKRGYELGHDFEDWKRAEEEILPGLVAEEVQRLQAAEVPQPGIAAAVTESAIAEEAVGALVEEPAKAKKTTKKATTKAAKAEPVEATPVATEPVEKAEKAAKTTSSKTATKSSSKKGKGAESTK